MKINKILGFSAYGVSLFLATIAAINFMVAVSMFMSGDYTIKFLSMRVLIVFAMIYFSSKIFHVGKKKMSQDENASNT